MPFSRNLQVGLCAHILGLFAVVKCETLYYKPTSRYLKADDYPFRNTSLSWEERVNDLVSRLSLDEIQIQMARGGAKEYGGPAPAIPRLGIGAFNWDTECLRGAGYEVENATGFPQAIGLAATFSSELVYQVASATGAEVRGKHNDFVRRGIFATHTGTSCFSPVINIMRDSRWGRNQETYGEDPYLTGTLAESFVLGLQGRHPRYIQASAGCKHFDVHGGPENIPKSRFSFDAKVSEQDWHMTFLPAFKRCVKAGTFSVMCSYNRINGIPSCANAKLLTDILRRDWGFKGYVVSDEGAIENIIRYHKYLNNSIDTVAACVNAGTNLELSSNLPRPVFMSLVQAVEKGKVSKELVMERVKPLFYTRMRLGEFDPPGQNPFSKLGLEQVETPQHQKLAVLAAMKSFVLLKNSNRILPLEKGSYSKIAVVGPMADNRAQLFGDYAPNQDPSFTKTPRHALKELYPSATFAAGCVDGTPCLRYKATAVVEAVKDVDLVFVFLGTGQAVESEGRDRPDLELPGHQKELLLDVMTRSGDARIVLLLFNAGPLNITFADESDRVDAIMECFFPAQGAGEALVNVLTNTGDFSSPAGRLPCTWPRHASQMPPMVDYTMKGRTYRYLIGDPLYPFGYGLSYSSFEYSELNYTKTIRALEDLMVSVKVTNSGTVNAEEVTQCYISWDDPALPTPHRQLAFFDRIYLGAGQSIVQSFFISWESMMFWQGGVWIIESGTMNLYCGGQQPNQTKTAPSNVLSGQFHITTSVRKVKF